MSSKAGDVDYISDGFEAIFGIPSSVVQNDTSRLLDRIHPADRDRVRDVLDQSAAAVTADDHTVRVIWPDGTIRWIHTRIFPFRDETRIRSAKLLV